MEHTAIQSSGQTNSIKIPYNSETYNLENQNSELSVKKIDFTPLNI